jgi:hypothetical protein
MRNFKKYLLEYLLLIFVILLCVPGFWNIYFGVNASPDFYQNLHVVTSLTWLFLLLYQLSLIGKKQHANHRTIGLSILFFGPLLFATTSLLSVHSAHKGIVTGEGDFLIVQNVMGTLELGVVILLAFVFKKRRKIHGAFLLSTAILFFGIALFFTFINAVPQFKIEGPETFYRFGTAAATARYVCLFIGLLFFLKDRKNGWPVLLVSSFFSLNEYINQLLNKHNLIQPLTEAVGSINQFLIFFGNFGVLLILLTLTGIADRSRLAKAGQFFAGQKNK